MKIKKFPEFDIGKKLQQLQELVVENPDLTQEQRDKLEKAGVHQIIFGETTESKELTQMNKNYEVIGFKPGAFVVWDGANGVVDPEMGVVHSHRSNVGGFYPADRYPIDIKYNRGIFEYQIFAEHELFTEFSNLNSEEKAKDFAEKYKDKISYKILESEVGIQIQEEQNKLFELLAEDEQAFQNYIESEGFKKLCENFELKGLPYLRLYAEKLEEDFTNGAEWLARAIEEFKENKNFGKLKLIIPEQGNPISSPPNSEVFSLKELEGSTLKLAGVGTEGPSIQEILEVFDSSTTQEIPEGGDLHTKALKKS